MANFHALPAVMTKEEANAKAELVRLKFYRTSVQENYQVDEVFKYLTQMYLEKTRAEEAAKREQAKQQKTSFAETAPDEKAAPNFRAKESSTTGAGIRLESVPRQRTKGKKKSGLLDSCTLL